MLIYLSLLHTREEKSKFETLYDSYKYTMHYVAFGILNDRQLSEDAVHEAFIRIAKNFHKVGEINCPQTKSFVVIIVRNVALTMIQKESKVTVAEELENIQGMSTEMEAEIFHQFDLEIIVQTIMELSDTFKDVLYLRFIHKYAISEIAHMLDLPKETVKKRIGRGRKVLAKNLLKKGVGVDVR